MEIALLTPLNALETSLTTLLTTLTTTPTYPAALPSSTSLITADNALSSALTTLKHHQDNYVRILQLRAQKTALEEKVKHTVFECARLRKVLGEIDGRILDDESEDEDEGDSEDEHRQGERERDDARYKKVDYETLLAFASRIGKHNAVAQQEAEKLVEQEELEARRQREDGKQQQRNRPQDEADPGMVNGSHGLMNDATGGPDAERPGTAQSSQTHTQQVQDMMAVAKDKQSWERSLTTAPFPNGSFLRMGALGNLQRMREDDGEEAMEAYVEKMVRETELSGK